MEWEGGLWQESGADLVRKKLQRSTMGAALVHEKNTTVILSGRSRSRICHLLFGQESGDNFERVKGGEMDGPQCDTLGGAADPLCHAHNAYFCGKNNVGSKENQSIAWSCDRF